MKAKLIGESSAGLTAVEIYNNDVLVWSHRWFDDGCSADGYINGLSDAYDCMAQCADVQQYEGGTVDDDGAPVPMDDASTTGIMLEYDTESGWSLGDDARNMGQSSELVDALMLIGILPADGMHAECVDSEIVKELAEHIID